MSGNGRNNSAPRGNGGQRRRGRGQQQAQNPAPAQPAPARTGRQGPATVTARRRGPGRNKSVLSIRARLGEDTLKKDLQQFATAFMTASQPRILPTPSPNYANGMAFQKVMEVGQAGLLGGALRRKFTINPYDPFGRFIVVTSEQNSSDPITLAQGEFNNGADYQTNANRFYPWCTCQGTPTGGVLTIIAPEQMDSDDPTSWAQDSSGRWRQGKMNVFRGLSCTASPDNVADPNPVSFFEVGIEDQSTAIGSFQYENSLGLSGWTASPFVVGFTHTGGYNLAKMPVYESTTGLGSFQGNIRFFFELTNSQVLGTVRGTSNTLQLSDVNNYIITEHAYPLCAPDDLQEAIRVFAGSSHVRLGGVAFWMQPVASSLTDGGSVLAAQVGSTTFVPQIPQVAFTALSNLPNMKHVGPFKQGAYGWFNPDRVRDLEFTPPEIFQSSDFSMDKSRIVVIVNPQNIADSPCPYLFKVNAFYNYRWQSRVFMPLPTPCSWELLQRFLVTGAGYCNMGENPSHVEKLKQIAKDFATNPKNQEIAKDALQLMLPGLKGFAKGLGETFIPGWDILANVVSPYI